MGAALDLADEIDGGERGEQDKVARLGEQLQMPVVEERGGNQSDCAEEGKEELALPVVCQIDGGDRGAVGHSDADAAEEEHGKEERFVEVA